MPVVTVQERAARLADRVFARISVAIRPVRRPYIDRSDLVLTLTTYPARIAVAHRTIKSLLLQSEQAPVILYLSELEFDGRERDLPRPLLRLLKRHPAQISVRWLPDNTRSYKKLVPALREFEDRVIVTADDDVIYSSDWLATLTSAASQFPGVVVGTRGTQMAFGEAGELAPYLSWKEAAACEPSTLAFLTGRGGILYPAGALDAVALNTDLAMRLAPSGDDIWFKAAATIAKTPAMRVPVRRDYPSSGASQSDGLYRRNLDGLENDAALNRVLSQFNLETTLAAARTGAQSSGGVLVVIPTLGTRPAWLASSVASIKESAASLAIPVSVRIVAPTDAGLEQFADQHGIELVKSDRRGLSAAINDGWTAPHAARYVAWLGDDDLLSPDSLRLTVAALDAAPKAPAAYGKVRCISETGSTMWMMRPGRWAPRYMRVGKNLLPQPGSLFRWSSVSQIGLVDESLRAAMDQDLFMRLRGSARLRYVGAEVAAFRIHAGSITSNVSQARDMRDESGELRLKYGKNWVRLLRPVTRVSDRIIFGLMRRIPVRPAPRASNANPYTQ